MSTRDCSECLGNGCRYCGGTGRDPHEPEPPRWVFIERSAYPYNHHDRDVFVGPFETEEAAEHAMDHALLVDHLMQREGGGGTDCFVTSDQPDPERHDVHIIDPANPDHTGRQAPASPREALDLAIFALNTLLHPDASSADDMVTLEDRAEAAVTALVAMRDAEPGAPTVQDVADRFAALADNPDRARLTHTEVARYLLTGDHREAATAPCVDCGQDVPLALIDRPASERPCPAASDRDRETGQYGHRVAGTAYDAWKANQ